MQNKFFAPVRLLQSAAIAVFLFTLTFCTSGSKDSDFTINIRYDGPVTNLNPYGSVVSSNLYTCARIFMTLGDIDPNTNEVQPTLITELPKPVTITDGPHKGEIAFSFNIQPEAVWDNGTPVTGKDVEFTLKIIFNPLLSSPFASYYKDISGFDIDPANPKKFTVYFSRPYMLALESMTQFPIMPAYNYDPGNHLGNIPITQFLGQSNAAALSSNPDLAAFTTEFQQPKFINDVNGISGNGPYKVQAMNDQGVILVKKPNWWGDKLADKYPLLGAYPTKLVYKTVIDENVVENMMKNGELDIIANSLSAAKYHEMQKNDSLAAKYDFKVLPPIQYNRWMLNMQDDILKDSLVRVALTHIVNYQFLIDNIRQGLAERISAPVMPEQAYYAKSITWDTFDLELAKKLLAQAGWTDSNGDGVLDKMMNGHLTSLKLEVLLPPVGTNPKIGENLAETARLAGIQLVTVPLDANIIADRSKNGNYQTALLGAGLKPGLVELGQRYSSKSLAPTGDNRSRLVNPELDKLIDQISVEQDETKRKQLYIRAQEIIHAEVPEVFLYAPLQPIIVSNKYIPVVSGSRPGYVENLFRKK